MTVHDVAADAPPALTDRVEAVLPVLSAHAAGIDRTAEFPVEGLRALRDSGLLGLLVPRRYGGLDGDLADLVSVAQTLAGSCLSTAMIWAMHGQQVDALVRYATPRLRDELLPRVARGEVYLASVTTEPGKGGHLLSAVAPLEDTGELLTVARDAPVVTGGGYADGFMVTMRAAVDSRENEVSLVYLDRTQAEAQTRGGWDPLGMRGTHSVGMRLTGAVPPHQLVGEPGGFRTVATESMIPAGHLAWAACWLGAARSAFADLVALARSPQRPRSLDAASELATERLARIRIDLELVAAYLHRTCDEVLTERRAGRSLDRPSTQIHLNTVKVAAAELTFGAVDRMVKLAGLATGYLRGSAIPLERHFRDLRSASLNYADDRLLTATGALTLLDRSVRLA
jgi:acyl-CoA dehydrogenase